MILRRTARPQAIAKQFEQLTQSTTHFSRQQQSRLLHQLPALGGINNERGNYFAAHGVPGFLSPKTYKQTWVQYQSHLIDQINSHVADTEFASKDISQIHVAVSRNPESADFYNIAAMCHFNHLWWESLSDIKKPVPDQLRKDIEEDFNSVDTLRTEMLEHADAMFGNGFVWLMKEKGPPGSLGNHGRLRILCTYNAGSPYSEAWRMKMDRESSTRLNVAEERLRQKELENPQMNRVQNTVGAFGRHSAYAKEGSAPPNALGGDPLLCLNVWQHMWIPDYGILGKRAYLAAWWEAIDWDLVQTRYHKSKASAGGW